MSQGTTCQVCGRTLRSQTSISLGVGPVCARKVNEIASRTFQEMASTTGGRVNWVAIHMIAITSAQEAYRSRIRRRRNPLTSSDTQQTVVPEDRTVEGVRSVSRGVEETIRIEFSDADHAIAYSQSGNSYDVTATSCSCPHYVYRLQGTDSRCRHIDAFLTAQEGTSSRLSAYTTNHETFTQISVATHLENRLSFSNIDWEEEQLREQVLSIWIANRGFDGIYMSENDEEWNSLRAYATQQWEYRYSDVLGGTGNSFGIEIEFEMPSHLREYEVSEALYRADILDRNSVFGYHQGVQQVGPGYWRLERDGSLQNGLELVSPVLFDKKEHWEQIEKATKVLRELGANVSTRTGGHIHVGIAPMDHRSYSWQRLARIGLAYERAFYRMGGADSAAFENGSRGIHRGTNYSLPFTSTAYSISGSESAESARRKLSGAGRRTMFNATNVDAPHHQKPTLEMRYPNGSLDHRQIQAQVIVANAVVHQAAVIRNASPLNRFTPRLMDRRNQLLVTDQPLALEEDKNFRKFLDVLGNQHDRLAATWLYLRGSSPVQD